MSFHSLMVITDVDIEKAEQVLLPDGMHFDGERRLFIKDLESCDLLAVPGSGKTTALQAKLICMARHLPLGEDKGILVLSHTNNAVNEVKKKLRSECYQLLDAPHFIGTVQDFVDKFLAIPYYEQCFKQKVHVIDGMAYEQEVERYLNASFYRLTRGTKYLRNKKFEFASIRIRHINGGVLEFTKGLDEKLSFKPVKKWIDEGIEQKMHDDIRADLVKMKKNILRKGILHYDDCYFLADTYIHKYPFVVQALRKRFKYVFIDETQDLKKYQLDLIDYIFDCDECCLQRVGDKNQTIFNRPDRTVPEQWIVRKMACLQNSLRLTDSIAKVVNPFAVDKAVDDTGKPRFTVVGKRQLEHGDIPPYLILFDEDTKDELLPTFNNLIERYHLRTARESNKYGFHVVGWSLKRNAGEVKDKLRLEDIFPNCEKSSDKGLSSYTTLSKFLVFGCRELSMHECKSVIQKAMICVLRNLDILDSEGSFYSKTTLEKQMGLLDEEDYNEYKLLLYRASVLMFQQGYSECYTLVADYLKGRFSQIFKISNNNKVLTDFCEKGFDTGLLNIDAPTSFPDIKIESVHSTKGQTHCATMYVETSFKDYESSHLFKQKKKATKKASATFYPNPLFQEEARYKQVTCQAVMRMMYVGFSRPTHLLCFAAVKDNWNNDRIRKMRSLGWKIIVL